MEPTNGGSAASTGAGASTPSVELTGTIIAPVRGHASIGHYARELESSHPDAKKRKGKEIARPDTTSTTYKTYFNMYRRFIAHHPEHKESWRFVTQSGILAYVASGLKASKERSNYETGDHVPLTERKK